MRNKSSAQRNAQRRRAKKAAAQISSSAATLGHLAAGAMEGAIIGGICADTLLKNLFKPFGITALSAAILDLVATVCKEGSTAKEICWKAIKTIPATILSELVLNENSYMPTPSRFLLAALIGTILQAAEKGYQWGFEAGKANVAAGFLPLVEDEAAPGQNQSTVSKMWSWVSAGASYIPYPKMILVAALLLRTVTVGEALEQAQAGKVALDFKVLAGLIAGLQGAAVTQGMISGVAKLIEHFSSRQPEQQDYRQLSGQGARSEDALSIQVQPSFAAS